MSKLSKCIAAAIIMLGLGFTGMSTAEAGGFGFQFGNKNFQVGFGHNHNHNHYPIVKPYVPPVHCHYKWVTVWETRTVSEVVYVNAYDAYGNLITVPKTIWKTITVPVSKYVKVCH
jgi:hypothetical protein